MHADEHHRKVAIVLEELGFEYDVVPIDIHTGEHKGPEYTKINPNGRLPTLVDHSNGDFTIWCVQGWLYRLDVADRSATAGNLTRFFCTSSKNMTRSTS